MLNEEKIKLMTNISMFEKREGKRIFPINRYFRGDYVSSHILRSFLGYTLCWMLGAVIWGLYHVEALLSNVLLDNVWEILRMSGSWYVIGLAAYLIITFVVYSKRYHYANRGIKVYVSKLKRLDKRYEFQHKTKEVVREGGKRDRTFGI